MSIAIKESPVPAYACNGKLLTFDRPLIMAIVNLTPDSFYDGGKFSDTNDVLRDVGEKINCGATIIDLGASSSRPGAAALSMDEEWTRLQPALESVRKHFPSVFISIDTYHARVASNAASEGADIINDISAGELDPLMHSTIAALDLPYVIMHMPGTPATMQQTPPYQNVVTHVLQYLTEKSNRLQKAGVKKIILDPGFGFGKSLENNYELLRHLSVFRATGFPVLAGLSRKSMISRVTGTNPVTALTGTTAANTLALLNGASVLRVHDVTEARQTIDLITYYQSTGAK